MISMVLGFFSEVTALWVPEGGTIALAGTVIRGRPHVLQN